MPLAPIGRACLCRAPPQLKNGRLVIVPGYTRRYANCKSPRRIVKADTLCVLSLGLAVATVLAAGLAFEALHRAERPQGAGDGTELRLPGDSAGLAPQHSYQQQLADIEPVRRQRLECGRRHDDECPRLATATPNREAECAEIDRAVAGIDAILRQLCGPELANAQLFVSKLARLLDLPQRDPARDARGGKYLGTQA